MLEYQDPCKNPTFRLRKHVRRNFSSYQLQLYVCVVLHQISKCMHAACDEVDKYMMCRDSTWSGAYTRSGQANVVGTPCVCGFGAGRSIYNMPATASKGLDRWTRPAP
jgi:hypothetical protein